MSKSVEELIEDLNDQDEFVVEAAAGELEMMGEESVDALMSALSFLLSIILSNPLPTCIF